MDKKITTRFFRQFKSSRQGRFLNLLTCYDFQMAQALNETSVDALLVGDSLGNVVLGYDTTIPVSLEEMKIFSAAVKRGAPQKLVIADMPFGSYSTLEKGLESATYLFQKTQVEALKLEGAHPYLLELITRLTQIGIPVMGHIGLTPQSVHEQGGYYRHGKDSSSAQKLLNDALALEKAGVFSLVLECVVEEVAQTITYKLNIPTIGIGSGNQVDGQILVTNDLLKNGKVTPPSFCQPIADFYELKKTLIQNYLEQKKYDTTTPHH